MHDLLIIGGGIYGACLAWEGVSRGLSVALIEKGDFAGATSANSLKIIHGGLRYLQTADIARMLQSMHERKTLMRIAPHLVHPLAVTIPTYGRGMKSREAMTLAFIINDLLSADRNRNMDDQKRIPRAHTISRDEFRQRLPNFPDKGVTGGAVFYDARVYNSERLIFAFLHSAANAGAALANYVEACGFIRRGDTVIGVQAQDHISGASLDIRARLIVNAAGPWVSQVRHLLSGKPVETLFAKAINLVTRSLTDHAVGFPSRVPGKPSRFYFIAPWRGRSLVGTAYLPFRAGASNTMVTPDEVDDFLSDLNQAYPSLALTREDVGFAHAGLLPANGLDPATQEVKLSKHYRLIDHRDDGVQGMVSVVGVKYTTARWVAQRTVDYIFKQVWQRSAPPSVSAEKPLHGGEMASFDRFCAEAQPHGLSQSALQQLLLNYGTAYADVLWYLPAEGDEADRILQAETCHGVREEMAQTLSDVVFRRTDLGSATRPTTTQLQRVAALMASELGWSAERQAEEIESINAKYSWLGANG